MQHIFYFFVILVLIYEMIWLKNFKRGYFFYLELEKSALDKEFKPNRQQSIYVLANYFYIALIFIGLVTFQWPLFALLIILMLILPKRVYLGAYIDSVLSILILLFIILNKYHFHIDIVRLLYP